MIVLAEMELVRLVAVPADAIVRFAISVEFVIADSNSGFTSYRITACNNHFELYQVFFLAFLEIDVIIQ